MCCQFLQIVVGRKGSGLLTNEAGEVTSHLQGMLNRTVRMLEAGIKPVFIFDGEPPKMKKKELAKRSLKRNDATKDLEIGDEDSIEKFSKRTVKLMILLSEEIGNKEFVRRVSLNLYQIKQPSILV
nr:flap endonuclease 1-B-like [Setaria viridis]